MKKHVQILAVEDRKSAKGNSYQVAQCVVHGDQIKVGELWSFNKNLTVTTGEFIAEFDIGVNMDRKVEAQLVALHPLGRSAAPAAPAAPAAAPAK